MNAGEKLDIKTAIEKIQAASELCGEIGGDVCESIDVNLLEALNILKKLVV